MRLKLNKSELILHWKICVISGVTFTLTTLYIHWLIHLSNPETFGFPDIYMNSINALSSLIVGGYFGLKIFRAASKKKYLIELLMIFFLILICETILVSFLLALLSLFTRGDIIFSLISFPILMPLLLIFFGKWKIVQIIITIAILFLGFRYIKNRESRE